MQGPRVRREGINIWDDQDAAARVRGITGGPETVPTVVVGTRAMVNPSARQVIAAVRAGQPGALPAEGTRPPSWLARAGGLLRRRRPGPPEAADQPRRPASRLSGAAPRRTVALGPRHTAPSPP